MPTWCPFRLQFYCNGHSWLARELTAAGIGFTLADNAFLRIDDWERAQTLANGLSPDVLRRVLDRYAQQCCPVLDVFAQSYHWSFTQVEYATDLVFRSPTILKPLAACRGEVPAFRRRGAAVRQPGAAAGPELWRPVAAPSGAARGGGSVDGTAGGG